MEKVLHLDMCLEYIPIWVMLRAVENEITVYFHKNHSKFAIPVIEILIWWVDIEGAVG